MKVSEIKLHALINIGPYSHITMDMTGKLEDHENPIVLLENFKSEVKKIMEGTPVEVISSPTEATSPVTYDEETHTNLPVEEVKEKKEKKAKATKKVVEEVPVQVEVPLVEEKPKKGIVLYDSNVKEHKSLFGGYLTKKYQDAWKTAKPAAEIKEFTSSLNGKEFIDSEGKFVSSFLDQVHAFFG